jgi:quercetin dioxygenase-like cupin family protein
MHWRTLNSVLSGVVAFAVAPIVLAGGVAPAPTEHPLGNGATVTLLSLERPSRLRNPVLSTFLVDFAPGGSAMLHRTPSSGYLLLHVLSGALTVSAWRAGVGTYGAGETWTEPTFAYDIAAHNASTREPAEALVVLITEDVR